MTVDAEHDPSQPGLASRTMGCPECGAQVPVDPRYSPWCDGCDWNLEPDPGREPGGLRGILGRRSDAATEAVLERVLRVGPRADRRMALLAGLAAVPVHLVTAALAVGAVMLASSDVWGVARVIGVILLIGVLWQVLPRPGRSEAGQVEYGPDELPETFRAVSVVAAAVGGRAPHRIVVNAYDVNASYGFVGFGRRRVLTLGMPLWNALDPASRVALLAHEVGHDVNHDVRRLVVVGTALDTLTRWAGLAHPADIGRGSDHPYLTTGAAPRGTREMPGWCGSPSGWPGACSPCCTSWWSSRGSG